MKQISIILPTYNEKDNLPRLINEIEDSLKNRDFIYELIVVDDNSSDGTREVAQNFKKKRKDINLIVRKNERGLASAIRRGIEKARYNSVIVMDTDLSHDAHTLPNMLEKSEGYDIVIASRFIENGKMVAPLHRVQGSYLMNLAIRILLNSKIKDNTGGFLLLNKKRVSVLDFDSIFYGYGDYCIRLLYYAWKKGLRICEIGYVHKYRIKGKSKTVFLKMALKYLQEVLKLRFKSLKH